MQRLAIPALCPELLSQMMQNCWKADPEKRITSKDILRDLEKMKEEGEQQREYIRCSVMIECHGYRALQPLISCCVV